MFSQNMHNLFWKPAVMIVTRFSGKMHSDKHWIGSWYICMYGNGLKRVFLTHNSIHNTLSMVFIEYYEHSINLINGIHSTLSRLETQ